MKTKRNFLVFSVIAIVLCLQVTPLTAAPFHPLHSGGVIERLPHGYRSLKGGLFFHDGFYYRPAKHGFRVVHPPVGVIIASLPAGSITLTIRGIDFFFCQGVYYRPVDLGYQVVEKPVEPAPKQDPIKQAEVGDHVAVFAEWLNLRRGPGKNHSAEQTLRKGTELAVKAVVENWYFVELKNGDTGWVMSRYTRTLMNPVQG